MNKLQLAETQHDKVTQLLFQVGHWFIILATIA